jgi:taurine transport system permease protein
MTEHSYPNTQSEKKGIFFFLMKARATKPGETYGVPGQGDTLWLSVVSIACLIVVWWLVTWPGLGPFLGWLSPWLQDWLGIKTSAIKPLFLPGPGAVLNKFLQVWREGFTNTPFLEHVGISAARVFGAFLLACVVGIPLGLAMGMSPFIRGVFDPPIEFYRPIPPLAYLPLMIIWFGIGEQSKVLLIFLSVLAPVALGARSGVKSAAIEQIHAAYSFGASRWQVMSHVILPSALPEILTAMRIGIGFGWTTLVAAEMVAATKGLGYMVLTASQFLQTSTVIMGIIVIAIIAYAFDMLMRFVERKVVPWKGRM